MAGPRLSGPRRPERVLVVNAGSSSLKLRLLDGDDVVERAADLSADAGGFDEQALTDVLGDWPRPDAVGHRIVHGGTHLTSAVVIDAGVRDRLEALTDLAPLHQPKSLAALDAVTRHLTDVPAVACFDTAFHATMPPAASTYALPEEWRRRWGVRRYGFHGLSHAYAARRAAGIVGRDLRDLRVVTCHLGAGASLCAVVGGVSVDTTMGFTPLDGLVMATRSGSIDPGLVLWLQEHEGLSTREVATALEERSGLTALAGTGDVRVLAARVDRGDAAARLAMDVYVHSLVSGIGSMCASAGGLDLLVLTGGVGENSSVVRSRAAAGLAFLGVGVDAGANASSPVDADVSTRGAVARTVVVRAREDLQIAAEVRAVGP
ncbi:MAG: acetate/propionate family kinase [Aeromicrobium sp.]